MAKKTSADKGFEPREGTKVFVGIDPGKNGGVAQLQLGGCQLLAFAYRMPNDIDQLINLLLRIASVGTETHAVLEYVHSSPQMGVKSAFSFGQSFGQQEAALVAAGIPYQQVRPQVWQKELGCLTKGKKNVTKDLAAKWYPQCCVTHYIADALLIATYCMRLQLGTAAIPLCRTPDVDDSDLTGGEYMATLPF